MTKDLTLSSTELRKFGFSFALGLNILGCVLFYRGKEHFIYFSFVGSTALILAIAYPNALLVIKRALDSVITFIGWATTMILLVTSFYLIFTPVALLFKLFGIDLLKQKINKSLDSYWVKKKGSFTKDYYERLG